MTKGSSPTKNTLKRILPSSVRSRTKQRAIAWNTTRPAPLSPDVRRRLIDMYTDDITRVEELIGRDLTAWKTV